MLAELAELVVFARLASRRALDARAGAYDRADKNLQKLDYSAGRSASTVGTAAAETPEAGRAGYGRAATHSVRLHSSVATESQQGDFLRIARPDRQEAPDPCSYT